MFDDLQKRLSSAFKRFRVSGVLTEANMKEGLREVRSALLEADVQLQRRPGVHAEDHRHRPSARS